MRYNKKEYAGGGFMPDHRNEINIFRQIQEDSNEGFRELSTRKGFLLF